MNSIKVVCPGKHGVADVLELATGADLCVGAAAISIRPDDVVRVTLELLCAEIDVEGEARFVLIHPVTKESKLVSRVIFEDGSEFAPGPAEPPAPKTVRVLGGREVPIRTV